MELVNEKKHRILTEYLAYIDIHPKLTSADLYMASDSLITSEWNDQFLIIEASRFLVEFNTWAKEHYKDFLETETDSTWIETDKYYSRWLDYLTDDMWGHSDSYAVCEKCYKVFESTDSLGVRYGWISEFGDIYCEDCVREDADLKEDFVAELINNYNKANTILDYSDMIALGFEEYNTASYEHGWYGREDQPNVILQEAMEKHPDKEFVFSISNIQMFCTCFDLYMREKGEL